MPIFKSTKEEYYEINNNLSLDEIKYQENQHLIITDNRYDF